MPIVPINRPQAAAPEPEPSIEQLEPEGYTVGYGKPPKHSQFAKGRSGNPKGRPKKAETLASMVVEVLSERVVIKTSKGQRRVSKAKGLLMKTVETAFKGDIRATKLIFDQYGQAVPDRAPTSGSEEAQYDSTEADLHILEMLRRRLADGSGLESDQ